MTWIKTIPFSEGDAILKEAYEAQHKLYPPEYSGQVPGLTAKDGGIVSTHSLIPEALRHAFSTFGVLLDPELPLDRRQQELIASAVSLTNRTRFCSLCHVEFLRRATGDEELAEGLLTNIRTAPLTEAERVMVDYAIQITRDATQITPQHHDRLRNAGFDDRGILQITLIAAWLNYINRVADSLGVGRI